jgi:imidazolonepropionase-like amidohydrolase
MAPSLLLTLCAVATAGAAAYAALQPIPDTLVLQHATVVDGLASDVHRDMTVVIRGGRIESVSASTAVAGPAGADVTVIDLQNRWVVPGLIDAHVHLRDLASARAALARGVTTVRSLGVDHFADVGIRELHRAGAWDVPDVLASGYHVRQRLSDAFFLDFPQQRSLMTGVSGAAGVRAVVRAMVERRADLIKVMVTQRAGVTDTDFRARVLSDDEVAAAVEEATNANVPVAAHAHTDEAARAAVRAGVRTIEHGTLVGAETLALMRERGTCWAPTLTFWVDMREPGGEYDHVTLAARAQEMLPAARTAVAQAAKGGVRIIAGSDMRYDGSSVLRVAHEIAELARSGLSPMEALQSATSISAACLGLRERTGALKPGLEADVIVLDRDPLADLRALDTPVLVINNGQIVVDTMRARRP